MTQGSLIERITRSLAYMLRHQPEEFDLELDKYGYAEIDEVVCALNERLGEPIEDDDVQEAIEAGDRPRYEIKDRKIRALYGHSVAIDPGEPSEPPKELFVGLGSRDAERVHRHGLRGGRRTFLHLALTYDDAREAGRRAAERYAVVTVQAREAWEDGIDFYDRQSLFLSEGIPTDFLEVGETYDDGQHREPRAGARDRGERGRRGDHDRARRDERPREERPRRAEREERPRREEREERPRREERDERPARRPREERRDEVAPQPPPIAPSKPAPKPVADDRPARKSASTAGGFGSGIFGGSKEDPPAPTAVPEPSRAPAPAPEPDPEPEQTSPPESGGFGSGL